jgi:hypothetical protein
MADESTEEAFKLSKCASCAADVIWCVAEQSLKSIPVDPKPVPDGNLQLIARPSGGAPIARSLKVAERFGKTGLRVAHFVTCPHSAQHRKPRPKRRPA